MGSQIAYDDLFDVFFIAKTGKDDITVGSDLRQIRHPSCTGLRCFLYAGLRCSRSRLTIPDRYVRFARPGEVGRHRGAHDTHAEIPTILNNLYHDNRQK